MYLIKINATPVRIVNQDNVFQNTQFGGYYWAASRTVPEGAEIAMLEELEAVLDGETAAADIDGNEVDLLTLLSDWVSEQFSVAEYTITPPLSIAYVGKVVDITITGAPNELLDVSIGSETQSVLLDGVGCEVLSCEMLAIGNYVIRGAAGELANCAAVIMVVE